MKVKLKSSCSDGFSLIELLVVVAIIGILASIALPNYSTARIKASLAVTQMEIKNLATSIEQSKLDRGLMLVDGVDGNMDWGKKRIIEKFNSVGLTPESEARSMIEVFAVLTSPVSYISKIPDDPFEPKHGIGFDVSSIGNFTIEDAYFYEDNDPGANGEVNGTEGSINVHYDPAIAINEYLLRGWGPNSNYESRFGEELDFAYWSIPYDISNGVFSRGELAYHSTHGFLKQKYIYSNETE